MSAEWPRLSEDLPHREPGRCASCGAPDESKDSKLSSLTTWREHDRNDRPEMRYVVLCRKCSDRLIEPHPRLYAALYPNAPAPGAIGICSDCAHRDGTRCRCPDATANGGAGIEIIIPKPIRAHVRRSGKGQRSGYETFYTGPATACSGKKSRDPVTSE